MNPELESLLSLQNLVDEITRLKKKCQQLPIEIIELDRQLDSSMRKVESIKILIKENELIIRKSESSILDSKNQQGKYRMQLFKIKSNREYQALNAEINALADKIGQFETEIIESMEVIDNAQKQRIQAESHLASEKDRIGREKSSITKDLHEEERRLEEAEKAYIEMRSRLSENVLFIFDKLVRKNGRAVSELVNKNCGNCSFKVRPQIAVLAIGNADLLNCDKCGVFLYSYVTDESGPPKSSS